MNGKLGKKFENYWNSLLNELEQFIWCLWEICGYVREHWIAFTSMQAILISFKMGKEITYHLPQ